jgi:hypothetical protein
MKNKRTNMNRLENEALAPATPYHGGSSATLSSAQESSTPTAVLPDPVAANVVVNSKSTPTPTAAASTSSTLDLSKLTTLGFKALGVNANSNNGACWIGSDGANVHTVTNANSGPIYVVWWGVGSGAVSASYSISFMTSGSSPLITYGLNPGQSVTISCNNGVSGGFAGVYSDTTLTSFGQIGNTWGEFTTGDYGTYDVSREVFMGGHPLSISSSACTADMNSCVFTCTGGASTCGAAGTYQINNCSGAGKQTSADGMNGGCLMGANAKVSVTFS